MILDAAGGPRPRRQARLLPGRGPPVGRRLRRLEPGRDRRRCSPTFDRLIGLERLAMVHLNDSHSARAPATTATRTWAKARSAATGWPICCATRRLDHVASTWRRRAWSDGCDAVNVARLADLAAGRPLTPGAGPEEAGRSAPAEPAGRRGLGADGRRSRLAAVGEARAGELASAVR